MKSLYYKDRIIPLWLQVYYGSTQQLNMTPVKRKRAREPDEKYTARAKFGYPKEEEK
jgi:hypothetical protein